MSTSYKNLGWITVAAIVVVIIALVLLYKALMSIFNPWIALILFIAIEEGLRFIIKRSRRNGRF